MPSKTICYTGIGSLASGNHTEKEFLDVMTKHFEQECSLHTSSLKCKSCKKLANQNAKNLLKQPNYKKNSKTYKLSKKDEVKLRERCNKCKKRYTRKCGLKEYMQFTGADEGKC